MDVVKKNIEVLGADLKIISNERKGTQFGIDVNTEKQSIVTI